MNFDLEEMSGIWIRKGESDHVIVQDVYLNDCYGVSRLPQLHTVIDAGAHIGCFSRKMLEHGARRVIAVEVCPENIPLLQQNLKEFGDQVTVIQAALTYEKNVVLKNAVYNGCISTGGSVVVSKPVLQEYQKGIDLGRDKQYWADERPIVSLTLEELMRQCGLASVDLLKMDIEGSELSVFEKSTWLDRCSRIIGEYHHSRTLFCDLVNQRFGSGWVFSMERGKPNIGLFALQKEP